MIGGMDGGRRFFDTEVRKPTHVGATLRRLGRYFRPHVGALAVVAGLVIVQSATVAITPGLIGQAVDCYLAVGKASAAACWWTDNPGQDAAGLGRLVGLIALLYVIGAAMAGVMFYAMSRVGQRVLVKVRTEIFDQIHRLSMSWHTKHEVGDVMSRLTSDADTLQQAVNFALVQVIGSLLQIALLTVAMVQANVVYALLALAMVPFMLLATRFLSGRARAAFRVSRRELGAVSADLQESIAGVREVQAFGREDENIASFARTNQANRDANVRAVAYTAALGPTLELLGWLAIALVVGFGAAWATRGTPVFGTLFTVGLVVAFIGYSQRLSQPIQNIALLWTNLQNAIAGAERIFGFLDEPMEITDAPGAVALPPVHGRVVFDGVGAEYTAGRPILSAIDLVAEPGQTVAIVGPTGAGKTTLINLIPRFWDVTAGRLTIDGHDVRSVTQESLRSQIGMVLQDTFLFAASVLENIRYGRPDATDDEVKAAAALAHVDGFVGSLSDGWDTVLGERGAGLSQGQRQLLAIARAALSDPRILILDEATSSVDTRTERLIQAALAKLLAGRTSFVIAHRLSTIRDADQVIVLEAGRIVERGTHTTLLAEGGAYAKLYASQFEGVEADAVPPPAEDTPTAGDGGVNGKISTPAAVPIDVQTPSPDRGASNGGSHPTSA
ncbi:MAG: ABC transporter ATP-binding protein [Ardenticatenales bacterium]|nr:ABC transporter ATP-binding protein [Ardenticatenales bacterium]